jgi:hypothetical protein
MASDAKKKPAELHPDAWARFVRAVDIVAKSPPQHRTADKRKVKSDKRTSKATSKGKR